MMDRRLIRLDKNPGVFPVVVDKTWNWIMKKNMIKVVGTT